MLGRYGFYLACMRPQTRRQRAATTTAAAAALGAGGPAPALSPASPVAGEPPPRPTRRCARALRAVGRASDVPRAGRGSRPLAAAYGRRPRCRAACTSSRRRRASPAAYLVRARGRESSEESRAWPRRVKPLVCRLRQIKNTSARVCGGARICERRSDLGLDWPLRTSIWTTVASASD